MLLAREFISSTRKLISCMLDYSCQRCLGGFRGNNQKPSVRIASEHDIVTVRNVTLSQKMENYNRRKVLPAVGMAMTTSEGEVKEDVEVEVEVEVEGEGREVEVEVEELEEVN